MLKPKGGPGKVYREARRDVIGGLTHVLLTTRYFQVVADDIVPATPECAEQRIIQLVCDGRRITLTESENRQ